MNLRLQYQGKEDSLKGIVSLWENDYKKNIEIVQAFEDEQKADDNKCFWYIYCNNVLKFETCGDVIDIFFEDGSYVVIRKIRSVRG